MRTGVSLVAVLALAALSVNVQYVTADQVIPGGHRRASHEQSHHHHHHYHHEHFPISSQPGGKIRAFELNTPPPLDAGQVGLFRQCRHRLIQYPFGSGSSPADQTARWSPELVSDCGSPSDWRGIELQISGASKGTQYDRLGSIYANGVEVWRTDNPEPTRAGVVWDTRKDVSKYYPLLAQHSDILVDWPNYLSPIDTGLLNVTLDVVVHVPKCPNTYQGPSPLKDRTPQLIVPLSKNSSTGDSKFSVGGDGTNHPLSTGTTSISLPKHTKSVRVEIYASGNGQEEFWYTSISDALYDSLSRNEINNLGLYPRGPVREIQVWVDNRLAGFVDPLATIFTGGLNPALWQPLVAYGAFDQATYTLDLTPFVPILADGTLHNVSLTTVSAEKNGTIDANWFLSGNLQVQLDSSQKPSTGKIIHYSGEKLPYESLRSQYKSSTGQTQLVDVIESRRPRSLKIETLLQTGTDPEPKVIRWEQSAEIFANNTVTDRGNTQMTVIHTKGKAHSSHGGQTFLSYRWDLPLSVSSTSTASSLQVSVDRTYDVHLYSPDPNFGVPKWTKIKTNQRASGGYKLLSNGYVASDYGKDDQHYVYSDANGNSFERDTAVSAVNGTTAIHHDQVSGTLAGYAAEILPPSA